MSDIAINNPAQLAHCWSAILRRQLSGLGRHNRGEPLRMMACTLTVEDPIWMQGNDVKPWHQPAWSPNVTVVHQPACSPNVIILEYYCDVISLHSNRSCMSWFPLGSSIVLMQPWYKLHYVHYYRKPVIMVRTLSVITNLRIGCSTEYCSTSVQVLVPPWHGHWHWHMSSILRACPLVGLFFSDPFPNSVFKSLFWMLPTCPSALRSPPVVLFHLGLGWKCTEFNAVRRTAQVAHHRL